METNLIIFVCLLSAMWVGFLVIIRGIQFAFPQEEDSVTMISTAATFDRWRWPSGMHRPEYWATYMKDVSMLLLVLFQKIFRDKKGIYPLIAMQGFTNVVSALFIYFIGSNYWGPSIGFFISILFIFSFWPWQTASNMGHINVATMFFLLAVHAVSQVSGAFITVPQIWLIAGGLFFCFTLFSSSSSLKYIPLFFAAMFFSRYRIFLEQGEFAEVFHFIINSLTKYPLINIWIPLIIIGTFIAAKLSVKKVISLFYNQTSSRLSKILLKLAGRKMAGRDRFSFDHYLDGVNRIINRRMKGVSGFYIFILLLINLIGLRYLASFSVGFIIAFLFLTLPDVKKSFSYYWFYVTSNYLRQKTSFRHWTSYFAKRGIVAGRTTQGGWPWVFRAIPRFIPFHIALAGLAAVYLSVNFFISNDLAGFGLLVGIFLLAMSPIVWSQIGNAPSVLRTYAPGFIGILLFLGYELNKFSLGADRDLWLYGLPVIAVILGWNYWIFVYDVLPSRMAVSKLLDAFKKYGINEFYTYDTDYNLTLVDTIRPRILEKFQVHRVDSLSQVNDGWMVIPGTSNKTAMCFTEEMTGGVDFCKDPVLNSLLETGQIEKIAAEKFKTFGSSKIWIHDAEIPSYRDLILHEIKSEDRFRSYAWLLHTNDLKHLK